MVDRGRNLLVLNLTGLEKRRVNEKRIVRHRWNLIHVLVL